MSIREGTYGLVQIEDPDNPGTFETIAQLQNWTLDGSAETVDVTTLGSVGWRSTLPTFRSWSISSDGFWNPDAANAQSLFDAWKDGTLINLKVYPSAGTGSGGTPGTPSTGDKFYQGNAYVSTYNATGSFDNAVTASLQFEGDGPLTEGAQA